MKVAALLLVGTLLAPLVAALEPSSVTSMVATSMATSSTTLLSWVHLTHIFAYGWLFIIIVLTLMALGMSKVESSVAKGQSIVSLHWDVVNAIVILHHARPLVAFTALAVEFRLFVSQ
ncbi:MAG: hypothetical protein BYD32DRAFT_435371 [Podila humilis]|nr:MAG: hypothetical protein BYD32DRAFT_435371 [Podila humilis]